MPGGKNGSIGKANAGTSTTGVWGGEWVAGGSKGASTKWGGRSSRQANGVFAAGAYRKNERKGWKEGTRMHVVAAGKRSWGRVGQGEESIRCAACLLKCRHGAGRLGGQSAAAGNGRALVVMG